MFRQAFPLIFLCSCAANFDFGSEGLKVYPYQPSAQDERACLTQCVNDLTAGNVGTQVRSSLVSQCTDVCAAHRK